MKPETTQQQEHKKRRKRINSGSNFDLTGIR